MGGSDHIVLVSLFYVSSCLAGLVFSLFFIGV